MVELVVVEKEFVDALKSVCRDATDNLPMVGGSMDAKEIIEWIEAPNNYFEYKKVREDNRVKMINSRLKG